MIFITRSLKLFGTILAVFVSFLVSFSHLRLRNLSLPVVPSVLSLPVVPSVLSLPVVPSAPDLPVVPSALSRPNRR